jgi:uncharacterized phage-associated protein
MSNLKLQKLMYYAQGFSLVLFNKPLFPERIEAWIHGPVIPAVYHKYKGYGAITALARQADAHQALADGEDGAAVQVVPGIALILLRDREPECHRTLSPTFHTAQDGRFSTS